MNRFAFALFVATTLVVILPAHRAPHQEDELPSLHSKKLVVTGIAPGKFNATTNKNGVTTFSFVGAPKLHAVLPLKRMTLDAAGITGHLDASGELKDAVMTGGVHGTLEANAKKGVNVSTFDGSTVRYLDKGSAAAQAADIDVTGSVTFQSANTSVGSKFSLTGSRGTFQLRTPSGGELTLATADIDGPVTYSFTGVRVGKDQKTEPTKGSGTAGHLHLVRSGSDGTDYELHLSGGVSIKGTGSGIDADFPKTESVTVVMDEEGNFKSVSTDESVSGTLTPVKKQG